jgi:ribosome biogenesis GTPase
MPVGVVSAVFGVRCEVLDEGSAIPCVLRGRLKLEAVHLVAGDRVEYQRLDTRQGVVEKVLARRNELARSGRDHSRRKNGRDGFPKQVVLANPDQVVFVAAARNPGIAFDLLDRALAIARSARLAAAICVNKMDLAPSDQIQRLMAPYQRLGLPVYYVSAETREGLEALEAHLTGKSSFFWGGSGVGKSSLIQALTGADVAIGKWRTDNPRGPHTTNVTRLYPLTSGGHIADTPGFDWLELDTVAALEDAVGALLPEAVPLAGRCRFPGCSHCGELGCAVMAAVLEGSVDRGRYTRFRQALAEESPKPHLPSEILQGENELLFRMRDGGVPVWTSLRMYYLFQERPERRGLLEALGAPQDAENPIWTVFHEHKSGRAGRPNGTLTAKLTRFTALDPPAADGRELFLRERGTVKAIGSFSSFREMPTTWKLRQSMKGTAVYEGRAFWADLKPPRGERLPQLAGAAAEISISQRFEPLPELALGVLTEDGGQLWLDFLEVGSSEDELAQAG